MLRMPENEHIEASSSKNLVTLLETSKCTCALHYPVLIPGCSMTTLEPGGFTVWYRKTGESSQRLRSSTFMVERWWFHEASFCERPLWVQSLHAGEGRGEGLQIWVWWVFFGGSGGGGWNTELFCLMIFCLPNWTFGWKHPMSQVWENVSCSMHLYYQKKKKYQYDVFVYMCTWVF